MRLVLKLIPQGIEYCSVIFCDKINFFRYKHEYLLHIEIYIVATSDNGGHEHVLISFSTMLKLVATYSTSNLNLIAKRKS